MQTLKWSAIALAVSATALVSQTATANQQAEATGFVKGASASVLLRNTYWNRDWNDGTHDVNTWGQGFIAAFQSGYTQGTVGIGVDAFGLLGIRLDGGQADMFPGQRKDWDDTLSQAGASLKARVSSTVIAYGHQMPGLPVLGADDSRLLPQSFTGTLISSNEIEGLELNAGRFTQDSPMASPARDDGRLKSIDVVGGSYRFNDNFAAALYFSDVEDVYKKKYANLNYSLPMADSQLLSLDFHIYKTDYDNEAVANRYFGNGQLGDDNTIWSLAGRYTNGSHAFILAYQQNSGDVGYAYNLGDGGSAIWVANSYLSDFNNKDEKSVQASYELDFTEYGVPGLSWKTAYVYGYNIDVGARNDATEREIFNQVKYVVQSGPAKALSLKARNSILRTSNGLSPDCNEWRLFVEYPLDIL